MGRISRKAITSSLASTMKELGVVFSGLVSLSVGIHFAKSKDVVGVDDGDGER